MGDWSTVAAKIIEYVSAGVIGWLIASFGFHRRIDDFDKRIVTPIRERVSKMEGAAPLYVTREELRAEVALLRADFKDAVIELKSLIHELRTK